MAALLAARELGAQHFHRYTVMVLNSASKAMNVYLHRELARAVPEEELSQFEREGAGFLKGHEEGLEQGLEQGLERGRAEVYDVLRRSLLDILELRGLTPTGTIRARIQACRDREQLERWYTVAKRATALGEVFGPPRRAARRRRG
ncbi:MAG: hypothetical protein HC927_03635 [Deltaproteobacteria bacterium]|nr:hypothetical protein [Deltaproteobacteria bacterium]